MRSGHRYQDRALRGGAGDRPGVHDVLERDHEGRLPERLQEMRREPEGVPLLEEVFHRPLVGEGAPLAQEIENPIPHPPRAWRHPR